MNEVVVGNVNLPYNVQVELGDLISRLAEQYQFKSGETAAYHHVAAVLAQHLGQGLQ